MPSEKEYQELINNVVEVIVKADLSGTFTFLSQRWQEFTQFLPEESVGFPYQQYVYPDDLPAFEKCIGQLVDGSIASFKIEFRHYRKDGKFFWALAQGRLEYDKSEKKPIGIAGSLQNIEEQKQMEISLREREEMLSFIIEKSQDVISIHDPDLTIQYISPAVEEMIGYSPEEMVGKSTFDFIHPDLKEKIQQEQSELMVGNQQLGGKYQFMHRNGSTCWVEATPRPVQDEQGNVTTVVVTHRDITQKVLLEQEIEKIRQKLAMDFHDELGNHLTTISMLARRLLLRIDPRQQEMRELAKKINSASKFIYDSTRDFIWTLNPTHNQLSLVFLYLRDFGVELFEHSPVEFIVPVNKKIADTHLQVGQAQQIILIFKEAMTNVLKHAQASQAVLSLHHTNSSFTISLEDNGQGTDRPNEGNGLGNMKQRAQSIGSEFSWMSNSASGTCVSLTLN